MNTEGKAEGLESQYHKLLVSVEALLEACVSRSVSGVRNPETPGIVIPVEIGRDIYVAGDRFTLKGVTLDPVGNLSLVGDSDDGIITTPGTEVAVDEIADPAEIMLDIIRRLE